MTENGFRVEADLLGKRSIPNEAYYGVHTLRAKENFDISGRTIASLPYFVMALAAVKEAAADANCGRAAAAAVPRCDRRRVRRDPRRAPARPVRRRHHQGGAGTSTNMNANEVICNRALELMGHARGQYEYLHPNEHVNLAQSTNDVYPTAIRVATCFAVEHLLEAMARLRDAFAERADAFAGLLKLGRTQLQDAVPMTLGQEFSTYAVMLTEDIARLQEAGWLIREINLGATAIGTGITAHPQYAEKALAALRRITGARPEHRAEPDRSDPGLRRVRAGVGRAQADRREAVEDLQRPAAAVERPARGFGEINLPPVQAGSSIMPGKVNPVIPEVVNQVAFEVFGNDLTVTFAAEAGQLQLNAFEPVIASALFRSFSHLTAACTTLAQRCVSGITANPERLRETMERSVALATALNPYIGYKRATAVAAEAHATGKSIREVVLEREWMTAAQVEEALQPEALIRPRVL